MATPVIIHCEGLNADCLLGITPEQGWKFCAECPIMAAYKNGFNKGLHWMESWERCPGMTAN